MDFRVFLYCFVLPHLNNQVIFRLYLELGTEVLINVLPKLPYLHTLVQVDECVNQSVGTSNLHPNFGGLS